MTNFWHITILGRQNNSAHLPQNVISGVVKPAEIYCKLCKDITIAKHAKEAHFLSQYECP